jgi:hypothetical protein
MDGTLAEIAFFAAGLIRHAYEKGLPLRGKPDIAE